MLHREDFMVDRIVNYIFLRKFKVEAISRVVISVLIALEKAMLQDQEAVKPILQKPKQYMDMNIFDTYLF